ncbi:N-acetylmuramoyl-L-alanine amidase [Defluviimonas sp. 20V17]|uniref:N-acetylmuramoyl-L-alanine amidase n=1 Tax=Allgaiera indica TaxID=765699 RepID=A0AAN4UQL6_9RHOB|nr:N-acetylmuramoyl-L-alanine amidase [Allgaiera indica]KDB03123.1 N-acetylmuramoyl-L-alanine amidase [Defluviimonas sp. 20V17]GHE00850.1 N-acetylmuramoyl-L-alanine amidase [Allgaiera indica]SDW73151.1 N-acetylmuramoyl-L-alanine amidase [Allgaiera indica]
MVVGRGFPSPNHGPRRDGLRPELVVLHFTNMASAAAARARLCDLGAQVSAHWLIDEDGQAEQLVDETRRAWHAGAGAWRGRGDVNSRSIGIELANPGDRPFAEAQLRALEALLAGILDRWAIPPEGVIAHSDMAPGRKVDPGPRFDWRRLALQGLAVWPEGAAPADPAGFVADARRFGYPEVAPETLLHAFRLRFRPWGRGAVDADDAGRAAWLARSYPG